MKEQIAEMYAQAVYDDLPPSVFAEQVLGLVEAAGIGLMAELMQEQVEIVNSPVRFNGVHIEKIKAVFEKRGIRYDAGF